jgi:hypothetical protein
MWVCLLPLGKHLGPLGKAQAKWVSPGGSLAQKETHSCTHLRALCPCSLQPLFPGANELDQISKIHDVIGTPAQKTLTKFKQ